MMDSFLGSCLTCIELMVFGLYFVKGVCWLVSRMIPQKNYLRRYGENTWAIVTGGSDGIGLGFCQELIKIGFNVCMISRNQEKMKAAIKDIMKDTKTGSIQYIVADFKNGGTVSFYETILQKLKQKGILDKVSILVNNVGTGQLQVFQQTQNQQFIDEININCTSMVMMSRIIVPYLLKRQLRSAIINLSSFSAETIIAYLANYSASKAFNDQFSKTLSMEYNHKIDILSVRPLFVQSKMSRKRQSFWVPNKNVCARSAISRLGIDFETHGYWVHELLAFCISLIPSSIAKEQIKKESLKTLKKIKNKKKL